MVKKKADHGMTTFPCFSLAALLMMADKTCPWLLCAELNGCWYIKFMFCTQTAETAGKCYNYCASCASRHTFHSLQLGRDDKPLRCTMSLLACRRLALNDSTWNSRKVMGKTTSFFRHVQPWRNSALSRSYILPLFQVLN